MNLNFLHSINPAFKSRREDRNAVQQLKQDNNYSLTENNKTRINNAIDNLSKESGESNVKFLLDVADNLKYGTSIDLGKEPQNNWKEKLKTAAEKSIAASNPIVQEKLSPEFKRVFKENKPLSEDEKSILESRKNILAQLDKTQLEDEKDPNIKRVESNLDYFIASSATPTKQKKYILNRLDYFLSPDYEINPELKDKKTLIFAEMINDLVVDTKDSKIPNTKAINQKHHGMCAAISITRKLTSYEYKPDYVDSIMSELDATPHVMVYDKTRLGEGVKIPVDKVQVDFKDAQNKGYRIVDASTTQWMNIANMYGADNKAEAVYIPFDAENFDVLRDNSIMNPIDDKNFADKHRYYQGLLLAKEEIGKAKASQIRTGMKRDDIRRNHEKDLEHLNKINNLLISNISQVIPAATEKEVHSTFNSVRALYSKSSSDIANIKNDKAKYHFIPNEEKTMKENKVKAFIIDSNKDKVDTETLDKNISEITSLIEEAATLEDKIHPYSSQGKPISKARMLYNAAAAYRFANLTALNDKDYQHDKMIKYDVPDTETLLVSNIDKTINHIKKTGDERYIKHFSDVYGINPNKQEVLTELTNKRNEVNSSITTFLDSMYHGLGLGSRKDVLLSEVQNIKSGLKDGNKAIWTGSAYTLGMDSTNKTKIKKEYEKFEQILSNNPNEKQYTEIFNKLGHKDQLQACADMFGIVADAVINPDDEVKQNILKNYKTANGLPENYSTEETLALLQEWGNLFNSVSENITNIRSSMTIIDNQHNILNCPETHYEIIKRMEKQGDIIPTNELKLLQNRFNRIDKIRSEDEFSGRQGKISDSSLYKLTKQEKETLKHIDKSINKMYSETNKELAFVLSDIRQPLEEHARKSGIESGEYWTCQTGSGLHTPQEIKILEMITDNRYRVTNNLDKAVSKIKTGEHSGISGSSVFHNRMGGHAQYIAEISSINGKDVLYHDNTWGASEKDNVWVDSEGVTHTDYSDNRGGETGYITNDKYRNGNYVDDLRYKSGYISASSPENKQLKKLVGQEYEHKFPIMSDVIITGNDGKTKSIALEIKDSIFHSNACHYNHLIRIASDMTSEEIKAAIIKNQTSVNNYNKKLKSFNEALYTTPFHKGIDSQEDYEKLPDDNYVKVICEKAAFQASYPDDSEWKTLSKVKNVKELGKSYKTRNKIAKSYFNYSFAKEPEILYSYTLDSKTNQIIPIIDNALNKYGIKIDEKQKAAIVKNVAMYSKDEKKDFDGSLKNTIGFMVNKTLKKFDSVIPDSDNARLAKQEIRENLTNSLEDALYINEDDVNNKSTKFTAIANYIDKKYNPETNADFVKIYRRLQDMTTEEFNKETSDLKDEDIGIKNCSGFDILKRYKGADKQINNLVKNSIYQEEVFNDYDFSPTKPAYKYNKLYKHNQGIIYTQNRTFDELYSELSNSFITLTYDKMFNKYKDANIKAGGYFPAYPKVDYIGEKDFDKKLQSIDESVIDYIANINAMKDSIKTTHLTEKLIKEINLIPDDKIPSTKSANKINILAGMFLSSKMDDSSIKKSLMSAQNILELDENATGADYKNAASGLITEMDVLKKINPEDEMKKQIVENNKLLNLTLDTIINSTIQEKYRNKVKNDANNWIREEMKDNNPTLDLTVEMDNLNNIFKKYSIPKKSFSMTKRTYMNKLENNILQLSADANAIQNLEGEDKEYFKDDFNMVIAKIQDDTQEFVYGNIKPEYRQAVTNKVKNTVNNAITAKQSKYNPQRAYEAKEKFYKDYRRYHNLMSPVELLNSCLILYSKDSPIHSSDPKTSSDSLTELTTKTENIGSLIVCAQLVEMQELLMSAVATGNAPLVASNFKDIKTELQDKDTGAILTMDDNKVVDYIVGSLSGNDDKSTAIIFIDKLGLADKYLKAQNELVDFDNAKKITDDVVKILGTTNNLSTIVKEEIDNIAQDDTISDKQYIKKINIAKKNIIEKTQKMDDKKSVKIYLKTLDEVKKIISQTPGTPKNVLLLEFITQANSKVGRMVNEDLISKQEPLKYINNSYSIVNSLNIPEYSPALAEREKFNKKYDEFQEYSNQLLSNAGKNSSGYLGVSRIDE